ncbi:MAG: hypothetical protein AB7O26_00035 [Planctomycetaceae bacterium]
MTAALQILAVAAVVSTLPVVIRARSAVRHTTLTTAWTWSLAALIAWCAAALLFLGAKLANHPLADQAWYFVSVISLCPPVAVLGAKRPGSRVWNFFVLLPLLFVLGSPAVTAWNSDLTVTPLSIETPWLIGHGLVIVMGLGNYLGTRFTLAALLAAVAMILLLVPVGGAGGDAASLRSIALLLLSAAIWSARFAARGQSHPAGFDRVWNDFRDQFGIVWARRVQERLNDTGRKEKWPCRLELSGFHWNEPLDPSAGETANPQIAHALRWILRRFVDPEWIDARIRSDSGVG